METEQCNGCVDFKDGLCAHFLQLYNCPCMSCLVKVMCHTECMEYMNCLHRRDDADYIKAKKIYDENKKRL